MKIIVTGAAGFIGAKLTEVLLNRGEDVVGIDNLNDYYDVGLKKARLERIDDNPNFHFHPVDLKDRDAIVGLFRKYKPNRVVNLAAQAGVRYSLQDPYSYIDSNVMGFLNILEGCRYNNVEHLVFASSSSVYGANTNVPYNVHESTNHPLSIYAATKKSNEIMAHTYAHLFGLPVTGLRFFTVYGPWGRPDMSPILFAKKILAGEPIDIYNHGNHQRDFTYIDDIVEGVVRTLDRTAQPNPSWDGNNPDPATSNAPYQLYNIGNNQSVELMYFIECIEKSLGVEAKKNFLPMQPGDVQRTCANIDDLIELVDFRPKVSIEEGIEKFISWYKSYYKIHT
ncbi:MAG: capsular biosynthesis protein CpsI [Robiginitomaculum sp.]|nr:MAG: capsular biosynthesis protein CpsI [Robiginitomaculum sp.]